MDYLIQTNKFHKIIFRKIYISKIIPKELSIRNLLIYYLSLACDKYPTEDKYNMYLSELYNCKYTTRLTTYGSYTAINLQLSAVDPKYINDINYTHQDIYNCFTNSIQPVIINNNFDKDLFIKAKEYYISNLLYNEENEGKKAIKNAIKIYFNNTLRDFDKDGTIEEVDKITRKQLYNYYKKVLKEESISYIVGDVDAYYPYTESSTLTRKTDYLFKDRIEHPSYIEVPADTSQTYINMIYDLNIYSNDYLFYPALFLNYHLGGSTSSKLFRIVREKYGLCYSINSSIYGASGILVISLITNEKDNNKIINAIDESIKTLLNDFNLTSVKNTFLLDKLESTDYMSTYLDEHFYTNYFKDYKSTNEEIKIINNITLEDINEVYNLLLNPSLIHIYGGNSNE